MGRLGDDARRVSGHVRRRFAGDGHRRGFPALSPDGPKAASRILHYTPEAKLIVILRDPVQRAYSHFLHNRNYGSEPCASFAEALRYDAAHRRWLYREQGLYHYQLPRTWTPSTAPRS